MTSRKPLVIGADGLSQQLQPGDSVATGANAFFVSASTALPLLTALGSTAQVIAVTPNLSGDALAAGEVVTVAPNSALPGGLNIAYAIATGPNQITIGFSALVSVTSSSRVWTVCAHR